MKGVFQLIYLFFFPVVVFSQNWPPAARFNIPGGKAAGECIIVYYNNSYGLLDKQMNSILPYAYSNISQAGNVIKVSRNDSTWLYSLNGKKMNVQPVKTVEEVSPEGYVVFTLWQDKSQGILDTLGKVLVSPTFYSIRYSGEGYFKYKLNMVKNYGLMDAKGKIVLGDSLSEVQAVSEGIAVASPAGASKYGYIDIKTRAWLFSPSLDKAGSFSKGIAIAGFVSDPKGVMVKYGLIDKNGSMPAGYIYDKIGDFNQEGLAIVNSKEVVSGADRYGAIDRTGKVVIPCQYQQLGAFRSGTALVKQESKYGLIDTKGAIVVPCQYDGIMETDTNVWIVLQAGKYGLIDQKGKWVVQAQCDYIARPAANGLLWEKLEGIFRLINTAGQELLNTHLNYVPATLFFSDIAYIKVNSSHFVINTKGEKLKDLPFDEIGVIREGIIAVKSGGKFGFVDTEGKVILEPKNNNIIEFSEGIGAVQVGSYDPPYCIDKTGKKLFTLGQYMFNGPYSEGLAKVFTNYGYYDAPEYRLGYADNNGNLQISTNYRDGGKFTNGYAYVMNVNMSDTTYNLIDTTGRAVFPQNYPGISIMTPDGLFAVMNQDRKWGYADKSGAIIIPFQYEAASDFVDGMALVKLNGKVGGINKQAKTIVDFNYESGQVLNNSSYIVLQKGNKWGAIDKKGKPVIDFKYENMANFADGVAWAMLNGTWGILDTKGVWKPTPNVVGARGFENGIAIFNDDKGKAGIIDKTGKILIQPVFDDVSDVYEGKLVVSQRNLFQRISLK